MVEAACYIESNDEFAFIYPLREIVALLDYVNDRKTYHITFIVLLDIVLLFLILKQEGIRN